MKQFLLTDKMMVVCETWRLIEWNGKVAGILETLGELSDVDVVLEKENQKEKTSPKAKERTNRKEKTRKARRGRTTIVVVAGTVVIPTIMPGIVHSLVDELIKSKLMVVGRMSIQGYIQLEDDNYGHYWLEKRY